MKTALRVSSYWLVAFAIGMLSAPAFAAVPSIEGLVNVLVWLVVVGLIFWLIWWFIGYIGLPEPFNKVARVVIGLVAFIILIYFLLAFLPPIGHGLR